MQTRKTPFELTLAVLGALAVTTAAIAPSLGGDFVWDDQALIVDNPNITGGRPVLEHFVSLLWEPSPERQGPLNFYRPLVTLSYALDHTVHGLNPVGFRLTNLLLHLTNVLLLLSVALRLRASTAAAALLAIAWGVHPRLCESSCWIAGRTDVLALTWVLAGLLIYDPERPRRAALAVVVATLGLFAKEVAVAGTLGLVVHAAIHARRSAAPRARRTLAAALGAAGVTLTLYLALRLAAFAVGGSAGDDPDDALARRMLWLRPVFALEALGRNAWMIANGWQPRTQHGQLGFIVYRYVALGAGVLVALGIALWRSARPRWPASAWTACLGTLLVVPIALVLHLIPIRIGVVASDRFLYVPLAALALLLAMRVDRWVADRRRLALAVGVALVASFAGRAALRAADWTSDVALWSRALGHTHPHNTRPRMILGDLGFRAGLYDDALALYRISERTALSNPYQALRPHITLETLSVVRTLGQLGRYEAALATLNDALRSAPRSRDDPRVMMERARLLLASGALVEAKAELAALLRIYPAYPPARALMSVAARGQQVHGALVEAAASDGSATTLLARRAALDALLGRRSEAVAGYHEVLARPDATAQDLLDAAAFLVRHGALPDGPPALARIAGAVPPEIVEALGRQLEARQRRQAELAPVLERARVDPGPPPEGIGML